METVDAHSPTDSLPADERDRRTAVLLARAAAQTDGSVRRRLEDDVIVINASLARQEARRYRHRGVEVDDLEQVALTALVSAVRRYDPTRGASFLAYAVPTVRGELRRYFRDHGWTVRPPRRVQELRAALPRAEEQLGHELGRSPTLAEVAARLECTPCEVAEARQARQRFRTVASVASLTARPTPDAAGACDERGYAQVEARAMVAPLIGDLAVDERRLLALRYVQERSQSDIAKQTGLGQVQVSRRIRAVLSRMRQQIDA